MTEDQLPRAEPHADRVRRNVEELLRQQAREVSEACRRFEERLAGLCPRCRRPRPVGGTVDVATGCLCNPKTEV